LSYILKKIARLTLPGMGKCSTESVKKIARISLAEV
jgi:hypothetical protein